MAFKMDNGNPNSVKQIFSTQKKQFDAAIHLDSWGQKEANLNHAYMLQNQLKRHTQTIALDIQKLDKN